MNDKPKTQKTPKSDGGSSSMKQFMLSLLATTISIALTFGTAAVIDNHKKQKEKREIVMMVMYDMYNTLTLLETADSNLVRSFQLQRQIEADTTGFYETKRFQFIPLIQKIDYTEAIERIFSSSIETINTVGNVHFTENVEKFYNLRRSYKSEVADSLYKQMFFQHAIQSLPQTLQVDIFTYALSSHSIVTDMKKYFRQCKQIMNITDEQIDVYRLQRQKMENDLAEDDKDWEKLIKNVKGEK